MSLKSGKLYTTKSLMSFQVLNYFGPGDFLEIGNAIKLDDNDPIVYVAQCWIIEKPGQRTPVEVFFAREIFVCFVYVDPAEFIELKLEEKF